MPEDFNVALLEHAHEDGAVYGSKAVGEPPLMLAFSVREALREAAAAFGPPGIERRPRLAGHARGGLLGGRGGARRPDAGRPQEGVTGAVPDQPDPTTARCARTPSARPGPGAGLTCTGWTRSSGCGATRARRARHGGPVRGHAPREAGAKMVVAADATWGSDRRRQPRGRRRARGPATLLGRRPPRRPSSSPSTLTDKGPHRARRAVLRRRGDRAARAAARRAVAWRSSASATSASSSPGSWPATTSSCTWSTPAPSSSTPSRWPCSPTPSPAVHVHHAPVLPELVLGELPPGTHVLVMTHDHAEDAALCDAALRCAHLGSDRADRLVGQVGAVPPRLLGEGHAADAVDPDPHADRPARATDGKDPADDRGGGGRRAAGARRGGAGVGGPPPGPSRSHDALRPRAGPSARRGTSTGDGRGAGFQRNPAPRHPRCG